MSSDFRPEEYMPFVKPAPISKEDVPPAAEEPAADHQPNLLYTLLLLLIGAIMLVVTGLAITLGGGALHLLPSDPAKLSQGFPKTSILIELATFALTFLVAWQLFPRMWHRSFGKTIQWHGHTALQYLPWLAGGGVLLSVLAQVLESRLNLQKKMPIDDFFQHPADVWVVALFGTLVAPVCEEIFFRGFLLRGLAIAFDWTTRKVTPVDTLDRGEPLAPEPLTRNAWIVAGIISSGLFAAMHAKQLGFAWSAVAVLWLVGGVLTAVRIRLNSVAASTVIHAVYNGWIFVVIFFVTDGFRHLDKVTSH